MPFEAALPWFQAASPILSKALGGGAPAGPAISSATQNESFNTSGWTVATGKSQATGTPSNYIAYAALAVALVLGIKWLKHR